MKGLLYVESEVAKREGLRRGYFTYTDLTALSKILPPIWSSLLSIVRITIRN